MIFAERLKIKARELKKNVLALYLAYKRPDVSWYAKFVAVIVVGYALSPIDLIPDFIPVLGFLDDVILLPLGITLAIKLIPDSIMQECRLQAGEIFEKGKPESKIAAFIVILVWIIVIVYTVIKLLDISK